MAGAGLGWAGSRTVYTGPGPSCSRLASSRAPSWLSTTGAASLRAASSVSAYQGRGASAGAKGEAACAAGGVSAVLAWGFTGASRRGASALSYS